MEQFKVLLIEDNPDDARLIKEMLAGDKHSVFEVEWKDTLAKGMKRLADGKVDVLLLDLNLPDSRGLNTCMTVQEKASLTPVVILTGVDDETIALKAVKKGAQDYLIKGAIDAGQLKQSIRYAVARMSGEERLFTVQQLRAFDGREGRPAYIAYKGKVYDVSSSPQWIEGIHSGQHSPGADLTSDLASAPHGEEVFTGLRIVGQLTAEKPLAQRLLLRLEQLHPHPISSHFSTAYPLAFALLAFAYLLTGRAFFEISSFIMLILGFLAAIVSGIFGLVSWKITYEGKNTRIFTMKIVLSAVLTAIITACLAWRVLNPDILTAMTALSYIYLALAAIMVPVVVALGYLGGKIALG